MCVCVLFSHFFFFYIIIFPLCHQNCKKEKDEGKKKKSNIIVVNNNSYLKTNYLGSFTCVIKQMKREKGLEGSEKLFWW